MLYEIFYASLRGIMAFVILLVLSKLFGRKPILQMTYFDFIITAALGMLGAVFAAWPGVAAFSALLALIVIALLYALVRYSSIRSASFDKAVTQEPIVVVSNGKIDEENLKKAKISISELTSLLREKNIFNLADVEFALIECDGNISVLPKSQKQPVTPADLNIPTNYEGLSIELIIDGKVLSENLHKINLTEEWLMRQLKNYNIENVKQVFYASLDTEGNLYVSRKSEGENGDSGGLID